MSSAGINREVARFDEFELIVSTAELRNRDGSRTRLSEQTLRILLALLEKPSEIVPREELRKRLWPNDTVVEFEHGISAAMNRLRQALGDSAEKPRFIETLARKGYRWKTAVEWVNAAAKSHAESLNIGPKRDSLSGQNVSHYRVLNILGGGGMGIVYRAEDIKLSRAVALKFLPEEMSPDAVARARFLREARSASALNHPSICTVYEVEEHEGHPFIVMELLEGRNLRDLLSDVSSARGTSPTAVPLDKLIDIAVQVCDGLEAAHSRGIIHRDLKPANVFVQTSGRAKILDFGIAKASMSGSTVHESFGSSSFPPSHALDDLTCAGVSLGTAGYMSPEQVRGERLDARSDLFSFGLILYEMATGCRAFTGDTIFQLNRAVLEDIPADIRKQNPAIPRPLAAIVEKALRKDREARYQTAGEIYYDLLALKRSLFAKKSIPGPAVLAFTAVLLVGAAFAVWLIREPAQSHQPLPWRQTQLTVNATENPVTGGAISPDGKYLVFTDLVGIHIKLLSSGETQPISLPEVYSGTETNWEIGFWLPDSTHFFAIAEVANHPSALWIISLAGSGHRQLATGVNPWGVSPDGAWLAVTDKDDHEIWLLPSYGDGQRRLILHSAQSSFRAVQWSPDAKHLAYVINSGVGTDKQSQIQIIDIASSKTAELLSGDAARELSYLEESFQDMTWLPDGRLLFVGGEPDIHGSSCNLWQIGIDPSTSMPSSPPRRLTNWAGFCACNLSSTFDGRKLVLTRSSNHQTVYIEDWNSRSMKMSSPVRLTLIDDFSSPIGWSADSHSVFIRSNRNGLWGIYRVAIKDQKADSLISGSPNMANIAAISPDRRWVLYSEPVEGSRSTQYRLMRGPVEGGPAQEVLRGPMPKIGCSNIPHGLCILSQVRPHGKQLAFFPIDPERGLGSQVAVLDDSDAAQFRWDLSPDGKQIVLYSDGGRMMVLSLADNRLLPIDVGRGKSLQSVTWAPNGLDFFASNATQAGVELLYIEHTGRSRLIWTLRGSHPFLEVRPSPDGQRMAIHTAVGDSNMWMIEHF
jgi:serine/threonine protein kinase